MNQILVAAWTRIQATNVRGGASIGSTCAEGQHDEENAWWRYSSATRPGPRFHMTSWTRAFQLLLRLYLFRSTSAQQRHNHTSGRNRTLSASPVHNHRFFLGSKGVVLYCWWLYCVNEIVPWSYTNDILLHSLGRLYANAPDKQNYGVKFAEC